MTTADNTQWYVHTDASYEPPTKEGGLGCVLIDQHGRVRQWFSLTFDKATCLQFGAEQKDTIIYELELVATVVAAALWCKEQNGDLHIHFGDNDAVRYALVRGSATGRVAQRLMEHLLWLEAHSGSRTWYARVRTEANISDYPSRRQRHKLLGDDCDVSASASQVLETIIATVCSMGESGIEWGKPDTSTPVQNSVFSVCTLHDELTV